MPESRNRKKAAFTPPPAKPSGPKANPRWWVPVMLTLMVIGLVWIVVYYLTQASYPIPTIPLPNDGSWTAGHWNLVIGFGFVLAGFVMTTRWR